MNCLYYKEYLQKNQCQNLENINQYQSFLNLLIFIHMILSQILPQQLKTESKKYHLNNCFKLVNKIIYSGSIVYPLYHPNNNKPDKEDEQVKIVQKPHHSFFSCEFLAAQFICHLVDNLICEFILLLVDDEVHGEPFESLSYGNVIGKQTIENRQWAIAVTNNVFY